MITYCEECEQEVEVDEEGVLVGSCPNLFCPNQEEYQCDDNYLPLDFNSDN